MTTEPRIGRTTRWRAYSRVRIPRIPSHPRKILLVLHVVSSVGWLGVEASMLALSAIALRATDPTVLRAACLAVALLGNVFILVASLASLITGLLLSLGTPWGLARYYWVLIKFGIGVVLVLGANLLVTPLLHRAAVNVAANVAAMSPGQLERAGAGSVQVTGVTATCVVLVLLSTAAVLSVVKPWGRTAYGRWVATVSVRRVPVRGEADSPVTGTRVS